VALHEGDPGALGEYRIVDRLGAGGMGVVYRDGHRSLFVASASGRVAALDTRAGTLLWESYPRAGRVNSMSGPLADPVPRRGALLVAAPDGTLVTLDPAHPERKPVSG